jgi:hypothetical protein
MNAQAANSIKRFDLDEVTQVRDTLLGIVAEPRGSC